jgi:tRNA pseudouridine38-40 synthase
MRYALKVFYDGEGFFGSQIQQEKRTVEGEFKKALVKLKIKYREFSSAGRTDKGVSALSNVFALTTDSNLIKPRVINSYLPDDIRITASCKVKSTFNPRHAQERIYKYFLLDEGYNLTALREAATSFKGTKSFHNFSHTDRRSPIRRINFINVEKRGEMLILTISGESFLWQMVRRIITALKMAGKGEISKSDLMRYFEPEFERKIKPSIANSLVLWEVRYDFDFKEDAYSVKRLSKEIGKRIERLKTDACVWSEALTDLK